MKPETKRILLVEDNLPLSRTYEGYLSQLSFAITAVSTMFEAISELEKRHFDLILLDISLPDASGIEVLKKVGQAKMSCAVIMITADDSIDQAVKAMKLGAQDYLLKPFSAERLTTTVKNVLEKLELKSTVAKFEKEFSLKSYCDFIGSSHAMQAIYRIVDSAASSNATIFVKGESGTGKELMAQAIHQMSPRSNKKFVAINCAAIPTELMESEIFGHVKGAFTGANEARDGAALQADNGTMFFDEICEMDLSLQAKLLRFVQTGTFQKVGSDKLEKVDIRFICATNKDPFTEVERGTFREDLYYRLHIIPATLPPLRERGNDIMELSAHFLDYYAKDYDKDFNTFDTIVSERLMDHPWPGNVRELQNVIQRIVVLNSGTSVTVGMLPKYLLNAPTSTLNGKNKLPQNANASSDSDSSVKPMWRIELDQIQLALSATDNNVPKAAALLEVSPSTIYRRLKELPT